jgi:hypothetical protein
MIVAWVGPTEGCVVVERHLGVWGWAFGHRYSISLRTNKTNQKAT